MVLYTGTFQLQIVMSGVSLVQNASGNPLKAIHEMIHVPFFMLMQQSQVLNLTHRFPLNPLKVFFFCFTHGCFQVRALAIFPELSSARNASGNADNNWWVCRGYQPPYTWRLSKGILLFIKDFPLPELVLNLTSRHLPSSFSFFFSFF